MTSTTHPGAGLPPDVVALLETSPADVEDLRDRPTPEFVAALRERYPTEREYDVVLTRKAERRSLPPYTALTIPELQTYVEKFLRDHVDGPHHITDLGWLSGGASKIQLRFTLHRDGEKPVRLVLRMEPPESLNTTSRRREYEVIRALQDELPVPTVYWADFDGTWFPEPAIIYSMVDGVTKPRASEGRVSGTGSHFDARLQTAVGDQFVEHLAALHSLDHSSLALDSFDRPAVGTTESPLWQLNRARRVWEEDRGEDFPLVEVAAGWLERNLPPVDHVSIVHGDFRTGNVLFDEDSGGVTAWLDWERAHLGDRHRDLAWATLPTFGTVSPDGTFLVCGLVPYDEFLRRYEQASGLTVDPARLRYYRVLCLYQLIVSSLGTAYRVLRLGKSHQDIVLSWIEGVVYPMADTIRSMLEEEF